MAKDAKNKAIHSKLNAWGQDEKTAKGIRKHLRKERAIKSFMKGSQARYKAGYV